MFKVDTSKGPEFWAKRAADKIMFVSETAPQPIRDQAVAFRRQIEAVILQHMREAIKSDRSNILKE